ncbi:autophagy-related protein 22-like protein [Dichotomocladium elegans]|nr:autophagy-related protein 22-like protein [Dichotomocladium elegans]
MVQYLISLNGWDPNKEPVGRVRCSGDSPCETFLGGSAISVQSIMLVAGGLNALIQALLLTTIGSLADYGNNGSYLLIVITLISCAAQVAFIAFDDQSRDYWGLPLTVGLIFQVTYGASLVFYWAIFPSLAVNDPKVRSARRNKMGQETYMVLESRVRNHLSTISTAWSNIGFLAISLINIGVGNGLASHYQLPWYDLPQYTNSIFSAVCGGYWLICALPWFFVQKRRPGPPLPPQANYLTHGWKRAGRALKEYDRLPQTFVFLLGYFFLMDAVSSHNQVLQVLTYQLTDYNGLLQTYMNLVNSGCSIIGCFAFLYFQKYFSLSTKTMLQISTAFTLAIPLWGCIGIASDTIGYHTLSELWIYQGWFGVFTAPFYAYSQTLMSELIPMGYENMFFALFGMISKIAQFFGPAVIGGISQATGNARTGFIFCTVSQFLAFVVTQWVDMEKAELHIKVYSEQERRKSHPLDLTDDLFDTDHERSNSHSSVSLHYLTPPPPPSHQHQRQHNQGTLGDSKYYNYHGVTREGEEEDRYGL